MLLILLISMNSISVSINYVVNNDKISKENFLKTIANYVCN